MPNSLLTGVSGLLAHQRLLDVVGHNIANMNTTGFKAQRLMFADLLYETIKPATSSNDGGSGGTNPNQIGSGVKAAETNRRFSQGTLESTGGDFDFAISGNGFFTLSDSTTDYYTRAGAFSLDEGGYLVAPGGLYVKRFSSAGEADGINPGFQVSGDSRIQIPLGASVEGVVTTNVDVTGNLNSESGGAIAQSLTTVNPFTVGGVAATATDLLNSMDSVATPYVDGDIITITGTGNDGSQILSQLTVTAATTLGDLRDAATAAFPGADASLSGGVLQIQANEAGNSSLNVQLLNDVGNTGEGIEFQSHLFQLEDEGQNAASAVSVVTVYDIQGGKHELTLKFEKQNDDAWNMTAVMDAGEGQMLDDTIENIVFNDNGVLTSTSNPTMTMQINGIEFPQPITFNFGNQSSPTKLSHFNSDSSVSATADGSPPGVLSDVLVDADGEVTGVASNGKVFALAKIAVARFGNPKGLIARGDNRYIASLNSGDPELGSGGTGGRGSISGGQLEASNVDVAAEFTKLIVAQTGYNANARTITVSQEILEELTNIIR